MGLLGKEGRTVAFITWLDLHAGAVQAASAVVAVFLTAVVALLTSRLLWLLWLLWLYNDWSSAARSEDHAL